MKANYKSTILLIVLLLVALVGAVALSQQSQETRRGAYFAGAKVILQPADSQKRVGDIVPIDMYVETANGAKIDFIETQICYGDKLSIVADSGTNVVLDPNFTDIMKTEVFETTLDGFNNCLVFAAKSEKKSTELKSGMIRVAQLRFSAAKEGNGAIKVYQDKTTASGFNPDANSTDLSLEITEVQNATYAITASGGGVEPTVPPSTEDPYLNFRMTFAGVTASAPCANWKVQVMVLGPNNVRKAYNDVTLTKDGEVNGLQAFKASVRLAGFSPRSGVAAFIKGPKSLQVKYGVNGQTAFYNKAGGGLSGLTNVQSSSPTFDFTKYPLLAGDVTGNTVGQQDGVADGRDFSYLKSEIIKGSSVSNGGNLPADLNGNCAYESQDAALFMVSLKEKQEQLY